MLRENNLIIDASKTADFLRFIQENGKNEQFWMDNQDVAASEIDRSELDHLFEAGED